MKIFKFFKIGSILIFYFQFVGLGAFTVLCQTIFMISFAAMKDDFMEMTKNRVLNTWQEELINPGAMFSIQMQVSALK